MIKTLEPGLKSPECITDLPLSTSFSTLLLLADDTKCFRPIRCYTDTCLLQQDLNTLTNWSNCTLLRFCSSPHTAYQSIFFVKSLNCITSTFNILNYVSFCEHSTRSSTHHKLKQSVSCTNKTKHFYFNRLPRLWNSLPTIDLNQPLATIISELQHLLFWSHFIATMTLS